ncbi:hypothetical protein HPB49_021884 [Dermacentor silvarum]|uniref:Uncharacterized protein n=1 Tax=Dermacentor silvarum TaxID=543639 RepID=A0ACB8CN10_DERSI|nr:hypothetical protein HPB49_021884 [Dermacentor silvarum]
MPTFTPQRQDVTIQARKKEKKEGEPFKPTSSSSTHSYLAYFDLRGCTAASSYCSRATGVGAAATNFIYFYFLIEDCMANSSTSRQVIMHPTATATSAPGFADALASLAPPPSGMRHVAGHVKTTSRCEAASSCTESVVFHSASRARKRLRSGTRRCTTAALLRRLPVSSGYSSAEPIPGIEARVIGGDEPTDKRKRPLRFSGQQDIQLLQEVVSLNPFKDTPPTTAWASISRNLESVLSISSRRCRERTILMLDQYIKGDLASLQRFCTKDEFAVKEQLLQQAPQAAAAQEDDDDDFDLYKPRVILQEESTPEHSDSLEPSSEHDKDDQQDQSPKRPRLTEDEVLIEEIKAAAAAAAAAAAEEGAANDEAAVVAAEGNTTTIEARHVARSIVAGDFPMQVITFLLTRQAKEAQVRERELKIRREEVQLEKARLRLQEDKLALERARFEIERQERELRLRSELQERTVFMEVLKKVFSNGLGTI